MSEVGPNDKLIYFWLRCAENNVVSQIVHNGLGCGYVQLTFIEHDEPDETYKLYFGFCDNPFKSCEEVIDASLAIFNKRDKSLN